MSRNQRVLGISANENPQAQLWSFKGSKPVDVDTLEVDPKNENYFQIKSFPTNIIDYFLSQIELQHVYIDAVGISIPGNIDRNLHIVHNIARLHYPDDPEIRIGGAHDKRPNINIKTTCKISHPLTTDNDATCLARAASFLECNDKFSPLAYLYIDTGVNIGIIIDGVPLYGSMHPELGHLRARLAGKPTSWTLSGDDNFCGQQHKGCFESILSKTAIERRCGASIENIIGGSQRFVKEYYFIASCISQLCEAVTLAFCPEKILIGGYANEGILQSARAIFNANLSENYPFYEARRRADFIALSDFSPDDISATGAALLAAAQLAGE